MNHSQLILTHIKRVFSIAVIVILFSTVSWSQKIGYVNSTALLEDLPMMTDANSKLEEIQKKYINDGEAMVKALEADYRAYMAEANAGMLSKKQMSEKEADLEQKRQEIVAYDTKAKVSVEAQREAIFRPILQRIDQVIQKYGADNEYDLILDSGMGNLLYKKDAQDLTSKIRTLLQNE